MVIILDNFFLDVGKSTTPEKKLIIKTTMNIDDCKNNCQICPYGSSRVRYEIRKTFDITINKMENDHIKFEHYEIIIKKNNNEIAKGANGKLFNNGGWNFDLKLWFPMKKQLTVQSIEQSIPKDYGIISMQQELIQHNKFKYGLIVPFYNRAEYVKQFLQSLKQCDLSHTMIVFMDESLTKDIDDDKREVNKLICDFKLDNKSNANTCLLKIHKSKHGNMFDSILTGMDLLYCFCDYLMTIDSDTIHKFDWIRKINKAHEDAHWDFKTNMVLSSGFNVVSERHTVLEKKEKYVLKTSVGGCNMFFSSDIYPNIIRKCLMSHKWDANIVNYMQKLNSVIITTNPSVVQHIGRNTSINRNDKDIFDEALDFE
jgi:hypothetical protein